MRLIVGLPNHGAWLGEGSWRRLLDLAETAEELGVTGVSVVDHLVMGSELADYPYGRFPDGPRAPWLDPLVTLAAVAGRTSRLLLCTGVLVAPVRGPAVLAKTAATLDALSEGRLVLGVGTGWQRAEYAAAGLDWAVRHRLLDEQLAACRALWTGEPADVGTATGVVCSPRPARPGGVPVWIGGRLAERNRTRVVRWGDGWIPAPGTGEDEVAAGVAGLRTALVAAGRDPSALRVRVAPRFGADGTGRADLGTFVESARRLVGAGGTDLFVLLSAACPDPAAAEPFLRDLVAAAGAVEQPVRSG